MTTTPPPPRWSRRTISPPSLHPSPPRCQRSSSTSSLPWRCYRQQTSPSSSPHYQSTRPTLPPTRSSRRSPYGDARLGLDRAAKMIPTPKIYHRAWPDSIAGVSRKLKHAVWGQGVQVFVRYCRGPYAPYFLPPFFVLFNKVIYQFFSVATSRCANC